MSLSDLFCVERHKANFLDLVRNKLDITFANEQEVMSLIDAKKFEDVIDFAKEIGRLIVITRGQKGSVAITDDKVIDCKSKKGLKIQINSQSTSPVNLCQEEHLLALKHKISM